jgi:hypothetical protein
MWHRPVEAITSAGAHVLTLAGGVAMVARAGPNSHVAPECVPLPACGLRSAVKLRSAPRPHYGHYSEGQQEANHAPRIKHRRNEIDTFFACY